MLAYGSTVIHVFPRLEVYYQYSLAKDMRTCCFAEIALVCTYNNTECCTCTYSQFCLNVAYFGGLFWKLHVEYVTFQTEPEIDCLFV